MVINGICEVLFRCCFVVPVKYPHVTEQSAYNDLSI